MNTDTDKQTDNSHFEIERWEGVLSKDYVNGMTRLRAYVCGLIGGMYPNEDIDQYWIRKDLVRFVHWYRHQVGI